MMEKSRFISSCGRIIETENDAACLPARFYVRQSMRTHREKIINLSLHMEFMDEACRQILGMPCGVSEDQICQWTLQLLRRNLHSPMSNVRIEFFMVMDGERLNPVIKCASTLLDNTYALQATRPPAEIFAFDYPYSEFRTTLSDAALIPYAIKAFGNNAAVALRSSPDGVLLAADGEALFAMHGQRLITSPLEYGAANSVERSIAILAARKAGIPFEQRPILADQIKRYDEMMIINTLGITSLSQCGEAKFMSLTARRLAAAMAAQNPEP